MDERQRLRRTRVPEKLLRACVVCLACIALNVVGAEAARLLRSCVNLRMHMEKFAPPLAGNDSRS